MLPIINNLDLPDKLEGDFSDRDRRLIEKNLETLKNFSSIEKKNKEKKVKFYFFS